MFAKSLLLLILLSLFYAPGQPGSLPLNAPLLAFEVAAQDRIVLYDVTTGTRRDLHFDSRVHHVWGFSPDGCRLLYSLSDGNAPGILYSSRLDGSDARELVTNLEPGYGVWDAEWSPNPTNDRIAFTYYTTQDDGDGVPEHRIAWIPSGGGEMQFYSVTGDEHTPRWSPDGEWLTYVSYETSESDPPSREADLWIVSADGVTKYRLTNFPTGNVSLPRWSPDGDLVGFVFSPSPNSDQFWMVGNAPDAVPTQLSYQPVFAGELIWLPDSSAMLAAARGMQGIADNRLWQIPLVGNADVDSRIYVNPSQLIFPYAPRFSADGRYLAARSAYALALIDLTSGTTTLIDDSLGNTAPVWSPIGFSGEAVCDSSISG